MRSKTINKRFLGILLGTVLSAVMFTAPAYGQSSDLNNLVNDIKDAASAQGFELLDSGGGYTNFEAALEFDVTEFRANTQYSIIALVDGCSFYECEVTLRSQRLNSGTFKDKLLPTSHDQVIGMANHKLVPIATLNGRIMVYVNTARSFYTYSLLLARSE